MGMVRFLGRDFYLYNLIKKEIVWLLLRLLVNESLPSTIQIWFHTREETRWIDQTDGLRVPKGLTQMMMLFEYNYANPLALRKLAELIINPFTHLTYYALQEKKK